MAARKQPHAFSLLILALIYMLSCIISSSGAADCAGFGDISVYWGQHTDDSQEGSLKDACDSLNYNIVILESLTVYDDGSTPTLDLENHCGTSANPCSNLNTTIKHCQDLGIKVFLSIGMDSPGTSPPPHEDEDFTSELAKYLVDNFLSNNPHGPLGPVYLDGIDIADVADSKHLHWGELVTLLNATKTDRRIYLSVSPQCVYPDRFLDAAIQTGHVDYVWVEFYYNNPDCIYTKGHPENLLKAWDKWTSNVPKSLIFLGLAADKGMEGHIEPEDLKSEVLPIVKKASNYGGVMIWDRYFDIKNNYTPQIKDSVPKTCKCVCDGDEIASTSFNNLLARS